MGKASSSLFFLLALLACLAPAASPISVSGELPCTVSVQNASFSGQGGTAVAVASIDNPYDFALNLSLFREEQAGLVLMKELGNLSARSSVKATISIRTDYPGKSARQVKYAIAGGKPDGTYALKRFTVNEDWSEYENEVRATLSRANLYVVPLVALLLIIIVFFLAEVAYRRKNYGLTESEYTPRTLFFPMMKGRPFSERIADVFLNPLVWVFEGLCVLLLVLVIRSNNLAAFGEETGTVIFVISGLGAFALPLVYLAVAWYSENYNKKPLRFFIAMFCWGMFAAFISFAVSSFYGGDIANMLVQLGIAAPSAIVGTALLAPMIEELTKGAGVLFASGHHEYDDTLTGLLLGFTCGVGFSFVENWFYFASKTNPFELGFFPWLGLIFYRSLFNSLAHGCFTAATGAVIGYMKARPGISKYAGLGFIPGLFAAIALHAMFNVSALVDGFAIATYQFPVFIFNPALVVMMVALFGVIFVLASREEKKRMESRDAKAKATA